MRAGVALLLLAAVLAGGAVPEAATKDQVEELLWDLHIVPLDGQAPPPLRATRLDGAPVTLAEVRGRPLLLYFWASW